MPSYLGKANIFLLITTAKKLQKDNSTVAMARKHGFTNDSEVCRPRCAFKLYGEVISVKKHNYKI